MILAQVSAQLAKIVGAPYISRTEGLRKVWEYVKLNNLQNPANKAEIIPDAALYEVFKQNPVNMSEVMKLLTPHYEHRVRVDPGIKKKPVKNVTVSPVMMNLIGADVKSRTKALQKMWEYVKENNLQNPKNKSEILCDAKLKGVCDNKSTITNTEMMSVLGKHFHITITPQEQGPPTYVRLD